MERISASDSGSRGCGSRKKGGTYLCTKLSRDGSPLEDFLVDPVRPFDGEPFRAPILLPDPQEPDVQHAVIWVGAQFYPSPVHFIEEVRRKGASRRIPSGFNFKALTPGKSRMLFVHAKAYTETLLRPESCPKGIPEHGSEEPCIGAHWLYAESLGSPLENGQGVVGDVHFALPEQCPAPGDLRPGIFLVLPINAIEYEAYDQEDSGPVALSAAEEAGYPVIVIDRKEVADAYALSHY